jgi:diguanylate cyclase (GGDEF)-like protein
VIGPSDILAAKILIVDDQPANVMLLERMLGGAGYLHVHSTLDPAQVARLHRDNRYDLILLDIQMPGMDGFQVMDQLKEVESGGYLPVLAVTAQPAHKLRALKEGARDFVGKPFDLAEVLMRVHNMLEVRLLHAAACEHGKMLEILALNDPLTGLANRRLLDDRLSVALVRARRERRGLAVLCLDLDGFKQVNDTLGHGAGDALLRMVAARLVAAVREEDTVARVGGDEFVVGIWRLKDAGHAAMVAGKLIAAVAGAYPIQDKDVRMTTSVGIGIYPDHGTNGESLLKNADAALYEAKRAGKNGYRMAERASTAII